jgi:hypothetical protein
MTRVRPGETWFAVLPGEVTCACVQIDEITRKTVALRREPDLDGGRDKAVARYARGDVRFVERLP